MLFANRTKKKVNIEYLREETACLTGHRPKSLPWGYNEKVLVVKNLKKIYTLFLKALMNMV